MSKNPLDALGGNLSNSLGEYLREQRELARLSVRQLSAIAGVSNPYLSQIERGVKRPSAEILQQIAKGLSISAETLYVQAGLLDPKDAVAEAGATTRAAIRSDPALTTRQRQTLIEIYESFVGTQPEPADTDAEPARPIPRSRATRKVAKNTAPSKTSASPKAATKTSASPKAATKTSASPKAANTKGSTTASSSKTTPAKRATRGSTSPSTTNTSRRTS